MESSLYKKYLEKLSKVFLFSPNDPCFFLRLSLTDENQNHIPSASYAVICSGQLDSNFLQHPSQLRALP